MKLVGIVGSAASSRRSRMAVDMAIRYATAASPDVSDDLIDLLEMKVSILDGRPIDAYGDATGEAISRILASDCLIVATPIYRGTYTGALKNLLDHLPLEALEGKAIGLIATGATARVSYRFSNARSIGLVQRLCIAR